MPPLGMLFAFLVLGEHLEFRDLLGIIPVALGVYLSLVPPRRGGHRERGHDFSSRHSGRSEATIRNLEIFGVEFPMRNCASEVWSFRPSRNDEEDAGAQCQA